VYGQVQPKISFNNIIKVYGAPDFELSAESTNDQIPIAYSIVEGSNLNSCIFLSGSYNQIVNIENAGSVRIRATQAETDSTLSAEKIITIQILKAPLTARVQDYIKIYGDPVPLSSEFEINYTGFVYNDDEYVLDSRPVVSTDAKITSNAGSAFSLVLSQGEDNNYIFIYQTGIIYFKF
jgi:hypothetical protein